MLRFITQKFKNQSLNEVSPVIVAVENLPQFSSRLISLEEDIKDDVSKQSNEKNSFQTSTQINEKPVKSIEKHVHIQTNDKHVNTQINEKLMNMQSIEIPMNTQINEKSIDIQSSSSYCNEDKENILCDDDLISDEGSPCLQCAMLQENKCFACLRKKVSIFLPCQPLPTIVSPHGEKRKHSALYGHRLKLPQLANHSDSSSDDEIKDLCTKYKCVSKSPTDKTLSKSLWKNHQRIVCVDRVGVARPSLNLEKMQKLTRQRPRLLRIKAIKPTDTNDVDDFVVFKPINISGNGFNNRLIPVEEPMQSGCVF